MSLFLSAVCQMCVLLGAAGTLLGAVGQLLLGPLLGLDAESRSSWLSASIGHPQGGGGPAADFGTRWAPFSGSSAFSGPGRVNFVLGVGLHATASVRADTVRGRFFAWSSCRGGRVIATASASGRPCPAPVTPELQARSSTLRTPVRHRSQTLRGRQSDGSAKLTSVASAGWGRSARGKHNFRKLQRRQVCGRSIMAKSRGGRGGGGEARRSPFCGRPFTMKARRRPACGRPPSPHVAGIARSDSVRLRVRTHPDLGIECVAREGPR